MPIGIWRSHSSIGSPSVCTSAPTRAQVGRAREAVRPGADHHDVERCPVVTARSPPGSRGRSRSPARPARRPSAGGGRAQLRGAPACSPLPPLRRHGRRAARRPRARPLQRVSPGRADRAQRAAPHRPARRAPASPRTHRSGAPASRTTLARPRASASTPAMRAPASSGCGSGPLAPRRGLAARHAAADAHGSSSSSSSSPRPSARMPASPAVGRGRARARSAGERRSASIASVRRPSSPSARARPSGHRGRSVPARATRRAGRIHRCRSTAAAAVRRRRPATAPAPRRRHGRDVGARADDRRDRGQHRQLEHRLDLLLVAHAAVGAGEHDHRDGGQHHAEEAGDQTRRREAPRGDSRTPRWRGAPPARRRSRRRRPPPAGASPPRGRRARDPAAAAPPARAPPRRPRRCSPATRRARSRGRPARTRWRSAPPRCGDASRTVIETTLELRSICRAQLAEQLVRAGAQVQPAPDVVGDRLERDQREVGVDLALGVGHVVRGAQQRVELRSLADQHLGRRLVRARHQHADGDAGEQRPPPGSPRPARHRRRSVAQ